MSEAPHVPAAFINALAEEGTKAEAIKYLQEQWNENCHLRAEVDRLSSRLNFLEALRVIGGTR